VRAAYANVKFLNDEIISSALTVPGVSGMIPKTATTIWSQRGGVLGWTCGNMVASPKDVASFYYDLLVTKKLLSPKSLAVMQDFHLLDYGWAKGRISYGAGLMVETAHYDRHSYGPPDFSKWGAYMGHGGDTYGFLSEQGIIGGGQLFNSSFSVVSNQDYDGRFVQASLACRVILVAAKVLLDQALGWECYT